MKIKPIIADPHTLYRAGVRNLTDMVVLVHFGRCGLLGSERQAMADFLRIPYEAVRSAVDRLCELHWVTPINNTTGRGRACRYVVTVAGWKVLTTAPDFAPFAMAQMPLGIGGKENTNSPTL